MNASPAPSDTAALFRAALVHHAENRCDEAETLYRQILQRDPEHARALGMLALILADGADEAAAEVALLRHLALCPDDGASLHRLGRIRGGQGDDLSALALLRRAARALPGMAPIQNDLAIVLDRLGRRDDALAALDQAIALDPAFAIAHGNRGVLLFEMQRFDEAVEAQLAALACLAPHLFKARADSLGALTRAAIKARRLTDAETALQAERDAGRDGADVLDSLATVLEHAGRLPEALTLRNTLARRTGLQPSGRRANPADATVLILAGVGGGLVPTRYLVDPDVFAIQSLTLLSADQADAPLGAVDRTMLETVDVVFSALADVDHDGGQFEAAAAFCAALGKPVLNPPQAIHKTGRVNAASLFDGVPDLVAPDARYAGREALAARTIDAPLLARPVGDHGGDNLALLRNEADKTSFLAGSACDRFILTPFHPFQSPDGYWRKYRLIFVDRRIYPYHLAIGENWLLHYWRADMHRATWKKAEEERFLDDWRGVFGERAARAAQEVARRLDLDYGGMDCALTADGRLLLFEANACILLHLDESVAAFPYKHRHVPQIREAFTQLVRRKAGR